MGYGSKGNGCNESELLALLFLIALQPNQTSATLDAVQSAVPIQDHNANTVSIPENATDVALLFDIFKDPEDTVYAFGFPTFADFASSIPEPYWQRYWLGNVAKIKVLFHKLRRERVEIILSTRVLPGEIIISGLDWNIISRFECLAHLVLIKLGISGAVPFDKLPRKLNSLYLRGNEITGILNPHESPVTLQYLDLSDNPIDGFIVESDFEYRSSFEVFKVP